MRVGLRGQEEYWKEGRPKRGHRQKGPGRRAFVEGWANLGKEDERQDRMGAGCGKVTSEDTVGGPSQGWGGQGAEGTSRNISETVSTPLRAMVHRSQYEEEKRAGLGLTTSP